MGLFLLYFIKLGSFPLMDTNEPVYGQVAREMATGSGWLTPHYGGQIWFDKPPLFYWLSAASASVLGPNEFAYRLPSALLALGLVLLVFALGKHEFGRRTGIFSAVVMATCLMQIYVSHGAITDMTLVFCLTGAIYGYRRWLDASGKARYGWAALCGVMAGLAMLAKSPIFAALLFIAIFIHLLWTKKLKRLFSLDAVLAVLAVLAVGLPWCIAMLTLHRDLFIKVFILQNNFNRYTTAEHAGVTGGWYSYLLNIPILFGFFLPWSIFLPQAIRQGWRKNDGARFAAIWFVLIFVFFSLSKTILPTYIFPLFPIAALFVGNLWNSAIAEDALIKRGLAKSLKVGLVVAILAMAALVRYASRKFPGAETPAVTLGVILVLTFAVSLWLVRKKPDPSKAFWSLGVGMTAFAAWIVVAIMPIAGPMNSSKDMAEKIARVPAARVMAYGLHDERYILKPQSLVYYFNNQLEQTNDASAVKQALSAKNAVFVIGKQKDMKPFETNGSIEWLKSGKVVVVANPAAALKGNRAR